MNVENKAQLLLVEDDPGIAELERRKLERLGFRMLVATSVEEAFACIEKNKIDLMVLDQQLNSQMTGLELYQVLQEKNVQIPTILVTGFSHEETILQAFRSGIRDFIPKTPQFFEYLVPAVQRVMNQVHMEQQLLESEARLASLIDSANDGILLLDSNDEIRLMNPAAYRLFRAAMGTIGKSIKEFIPSWKPPENGIKHSETRQIFETQGRRSDGTVFPMEISVSQVHEQGRNVFTLIVRDITDRKKADEERVHLVREQLARSQAEHAREILEESEAKYRTIGDLIPFGFWIYDPSAKLVFLSRSFLDLLGMTLEQCKREGWWSRIPLPERERARADWQRCLQSGTLFDYEFRVEDRNGKKFTLLSRGVPVRDVQGQVINYVGIHLDITGRKKIEEELRELNIDLERRVEERTRRLQEINNDLESFTYTVSHDLRAPVRAMQGFAEILLEDQKDQLDERAKDYLRRIVKASTRMTQLIKDLLNFSRMGFHDIHVEPVDLNQIVAELLIYIEPIATQKNAHVEVQPSMPRVMAEHTALFHCLENLLLNALKFVPDLVAPMIQIYTEHRNDNVRLWVVDNGIGIRKEYQEKIFGIFERLHHGTSSFEGTGIGLAIAKRAVERMGGSIGVESVEGEGSRFWIELPKAPPLHQDLEHQRSMLEFRHFS